MKTRAVWFVTGAAAGLADIRHGEAQGHRHCRQAAPAQRRPLGGGDGAAAAVTGSTDAVKEGVVTARRRERELVAEREGRLVRLGDHLDDGDELFVDGEAVESARVIVMRRRDDRSS